MRITVEIKNLKSGGTSHFDFTNVRECTRFVHEIETDVYNSGNRHIRDVQGIIKSFIIYTSVEDIEQITVIRHSS